MAGHCMLGRSALSVSEAGQGFPEQPGEIGACEGERLVALAAGPDVEDVGRSLPYPLLMALEICAPAQGRSHLTIGQNLWVARIVSHSPEGTPSGSPITGPGASASPPYQRGGWNRATTTNLGNRHS